MHTSTSNVSSSIRTQQQQNNMIQKDNTMKNISSTTLSLSSSTSFSHVRVVVRVRPKLTSEQNHSTTFLQVQPQTNTIQLSSNNNTNSTNSTPNVSNNNNGNNSNGQMEKSFRFDQVFDAHINQSDFFERIELHKIIHSVLEGYHATIFAYGQTGSGKTFTMEGYEYEKTEDMSLLYHPENRAQAKAKVNVSSDRLGIIPRAIVRLYEEINTMTQTKKREYIVKCSFVQIYNEQIIDLLNPTHLVKGKGGEREGKGKPTAANGKGGLRLRWTAAQDFYVENLTMIECRSPNEVLKRFHEGIKHKIMASHNLNAASSRSHCLFTLYVESSVASEEDPSNEVYKSKLALVDLAGSERVQKTGATGITLQESIGINKSLFVLRQVIQALAEETHNTDTGTEQEVGGTRSGTLKAYIPYRDSKLTSLLKYSLGGNSITLMIACLSPSDSYFDENMSTLMYAAKAQSIANNPKRNEDPKTVLIQQLREEVESLKAQLTHAQSIVLALQTGDTNGGDRTGTPNICTKCSGTMGTLSVTSDTTNTMPSLSTAAPIPCSPKKASVVPATPATVAATGGDQQPPPPTGTHIDNTNTKVPTTHGNSSNGSFALTNRLKMNVIDNVSLIKQLYETEKKLREQITSQGNQLEQYKHETRVLNVENQSLREKMEVLEYLLQQQSSQDPEDMDNNNSSQEKEKEKEEEEEIPEYGRLSRKSKSSSSLLSMKVPSQMKILNSKPTTLPRDVDTSTPVSGTQKASAGVSQRNHCVLKNSFSSSSTSERKKQTQETTGLLSINDLKDLLSGGGSKTKSSTRAGAATAVAGLTDTLDMFQASKCSSPSTTSSNRRPVDVTQNLLATLESINTDFNENNNRSASTTGTTRNNTSTTSVNDQTNTFDRDALDSLSELNRLLRVKATLRRAASMGGSGSTRTSGVPQTTTMF